MKPLRTPEESGGEKGKPPNGASLFADLWEEIGEEISIFSHEAMKPLRTPEEKKGSPRADCKIL
jgi:hypothetical protein